MEAFITSGSLVRLCIFINYVKELCRKLREKASIYTYSGSRFRFFGGRCPLFWPSLGRGGVFWAPRKTTPPSPRGSFGVLLCTFRRLWAPLGALGHPFGHPLGCGITSCGPKMAPHGHKMVTNRINIFICLSGPFVSLWCLFEAIWRPLGFFWFSLGATWSPKR